MEKGANTFKLVGLTVVKEVNSNDPSINSSHLKNQARENKQCISQSEVIS